MLWQLRGTEQRVKKGWHQRQLWVVCFDTVGSDVNSGWLEILRISLIFSTILR